VGIRAFVAIGLDEKTRAELGLAIERLRRAARNVAWVAPGNLHITLKFLGDVDEARVEAIAASLRQALAGAPAFDAVVGGLGAFPTPARARVVWAGVRAGAEAMVGVAGRVEAALASFGFPQEARPFSPHVTLGRVRVPRRDPGLAEALGDGEGREFGTVRVERVLLVRSRLSPRGSEYSELAAVPLRQGAPAVSRPADIDATRPDSLE